MQKCLLCGAVDFKVEWKNLTSSYDRLNQHSILRCLECGLHQTSPVPTSGQLERIYSEEYAYWLHEITGFEKRFRAQRLLREFGIPNIGEIALEIGCGEGILLQELRKLGVKVFGCDLDKRSAILANFKLKQESVQHASADTFIDGFTAKADFIYLSHSLEHFLDPVKFLESLRTVCHRETRLIIVVPNIDNVKVWLFPRSWGYWQVPVHITHFSKVTLTKVLLKSGWKTERFAYSNSDFLTLGSFILNLFSAKPKSSLRNPQFKLLVRLASALHTLTYRLGNRDLLVICKLEETISTD